jgi:RNA polymerase sigma factor (sigma-70 family)
MSDGEAAVSRRPSIGILGASQGRIERLASWYSAEHERLVRFAYLLTNQTEAAEDLVQEAFIRMYRAGDRLQEQGFPTYARQTILNLARSAFRRRTLERRVLEKVARNPERGQADHAQALDVRQALLKLSMLDRGCLALRYYEGLQDRDIATVFRISEAAAKKRVARAHSRLRAMLSEEER